MCWNESIDYKIEIKENEFENIVKRIFKNIPFTIKSVSNSNEPIISNFKIFFPTENLYLKNSEYYLNDTKRIIHFTNLKTLYSILNEQAIRMYNLNNSNDSYEYFYAAKYLSLLYKLQKISKNAIDSNFNYIKQNTFIFSTTSANEYNNLFFWNKYGGKNKGVAIEFEIQNDPLTWKNYLFSQVFYGKLKKIKKLLNETKNLQIENDSNTYWIELDPFFALHKSPKWESEKEIRILTFATLQNKEQILEDIKYFRNNLIQTSYIPLPLFVKKTISKENLSFDKPPILKISKIYFGPEFACADDKLFKLIEDIRHYMLMKLGYSIEAFNFKKIKACQ